MSAIDKNQAMIDYLIQCEDIRNSPLYFNLVNAKNNTLQILTIADDKSLNKKYIDGSVLKKITFNLIAFKSISDLAIVKSFGTSGSNEFSNENVDDIADVQKLIDWIAEKEDAHVYPDFGSTCEIQKIETTTETPNFNGVDTSVTPPLAMYTIQIAVEYIDTSKVLWNS